MTNNHKPNQGNSQRRRASQPALPPVCTTPTAATTIVTIIIPASHQAAFPRSILQHQQQQMSPSISYEDPTPVMNSQVDVDVDMFQRMDIEDDQVPDMAPPLGFVDQFGQSIHQQQPVFMAPRVALSPSTVAFQALLSYPTVFDRPFDMTVGCPFNSTTAGNPSSAYQEAILSETAARLSNDQSDSRPRPLSQSEITPCLDQQQQQQQSDTTSSKPQATLSMYSYSTTSNSLSSGPFGQSGLDFGTTDPVSAIPSPSTASNERHSYISMGPSFSHLMYNSNSGFGYGSSLVSNSSSSAALAPAPAATTNTPAFGEPSFPASVTQVSTTIPSKPLAPTPPRFTLMSPSLSHTAAYFQYKQQRQQQEQSQAMCVDIPSSSSSVSLPNSNITVTSHSNTCRPSHDSVAFLSSIKEEHNYTRQELLRLIHRRRRAVQKRRRCMTDTDSGRETQYSDEAHCQNLPRAFESRRSSLRYSGGPRKDRKKAGRAVKELRSAKHLIVRKRKLSCELNEREYQVQMLCSSAPMVTPPSTPSAKDIRAYQEYRAFAASIDYSKIHHDPEEMRKYQKLERMECIFLRERRNPELARLEEIATTGVSSAENERTTILSSGLTPAEWLEAQGWIFSPSVDPLMVFTMQAPNELTGEDEESGVPIPAPSTVAPRNTVGTTSTTGASPTATSPLITPLYHSPSTNISTSSALPRTPRGSDASPPERQRTRFQSRRLELNEGSNQNREFKETGEARKQKEKVLKEERAQTEASRKARKAARQAQIQQEEDDEALAEEIRKQNERDRRGEINANEGLTPVEEESRQAWIKDQLEKKRTKEDQLDVEYQELLQQERHKEEAALRRLLERKRKEEVRREHKTRTIQVLSYEENTANTPSCKGKPATSGSAFISAFSSTTAETPVLTRTTSYATERDSTPGTDYIAPPDFDSSTTAISTTSSRAVHESSTPAQSSGQELPSVSLLEMSEAEQEFEEMNRWADQNVEYYDRITRERTSSPCNVPLESSQVPSLKSVGEQDPQDKSTTNSGQESRSAGMRRGTVDEKEYEGEEYEQQDIEYEQQQQDYKHRQQDDDNARKGSSSSQHRRTSQKIQFERVEAVARNLQNLEDSQRLPAQEEISGDTAWRLLRSEGERMAAGAAGTRVRGSVREIITLQEQQVLNDLAMARRLQREEDDDEQRSDIKSNRRSSLRISAQKKRLLSPSSNSRTARVPRSQSKMTSGSARSTPLVGEQQRQKPSRIPTRKLAASASSASTSPAQVSPPPFRSAIEYSSPALSWPPPHLCATTYPRRILVSSLLSSSRSLSPTQWNFFSSSRSPSRSPPRAHSTLYTSYAKPTSPRTRTRESPPPPPPPRTRPSPIRSLRSPQSSSPRARYSPRSSPPRAGTEHQYLSSWWLHQPEKVKSGLNLLAKAASIRSPSSSVLSTAVLTPKGEQRYGQVSHGYSTPNDLASEDATISMTQASTSDQPSPHSEARSPDSTTVPVTPAASGRRPPSRVPSPRVSRRSQRIQDRNTTASVLGFLSEEKEREEKEQRKAKDAKKKGRKPTAIKEKMKKEREPKAAREERKEGVKEMKKKDRKSKAVKVKTKEDVEEVKKNGRESMETKEEVKEKVEEVKTKGRKRKATEKMKDEVKEVNKDPKRKTATEKETEEAKAKNEKGKGKRAKK